MKRKPPLPTVEARAGALVRARRLILAMSQAEVALAAGLDGQGAINRIECGQRCTLTNLHAVAGALGVELKTLIP